jgi:hypothetical protein
MLVVWMHGCASQPIENQNSISGIDNRMNAFAQHCGTAGEKSSRELCQTDEKVRGN